MKKETKAILKKYKLYHFNSKTKNKNLEDKAEYKPSLDNYVKDLKIPEIFFNVNFETEIKELLKRHSLENYLELFCSLYVELIGHLGMELIKEKVFLKEYNENKDLHSFINVILYLNETKKENYDSDITLTLSFKTNEGYIKLPISERNIDFFTAFYAFIKKYSNKIYLKENLPFTSFMKDRNKFIQKFNRKGRPNLYQKTNEIIYILQKIIQNETPLKSEAKIIGNEQALFIYDYLTIIRVINNKNKFELLPEEKQSFIRTSLNNQLNFLKNSNL